MYNHHDMKVISLDGAAWSCRQDFFDALADVLKVVPYHGRGFDAFEDSVFYGGMSQVEPPFAVVVRNCPPFAESDVKRMADGWAGQREWKRMYYGEDVEATISLIS
jgi:RNAse (barnase) inhibitor barstar